MGLLDRCDQEECASDEDLVRIKKVNGRFYTFAGESRRNKARLLELLSFYNTAVQQGLRGEHIVREGHLITPGELAYTIQQFFVGLHPFTEGNGRVSRLLQESVLLTFGLPHGSSGDLMNIDVLTPPGEYYEKAMAATSQVVEQTQHCLNEVLPRVRGNLQQLSRSAMERIEYDCRIIRNPG